MSKPTFEEYIDQHGELTYRNTGVSMEPLLHQGRDIFTVARRNDERCAKYDVVLYRRGESYVLHRVVGVHEDFYDVLGDNCINVERVKDEDIIGVMTQFVRKGHTIHVDNKGYMMYSRLWCSLYPVRKLLFRIKRTIRNAIR